MEVEAAAAGGQGDLLDQLGMTDAVDLDSGRARAIHAGRGCDQAHVLRGLVGVVKGEIPGVAGVAVDGQTVGELTGG